MKVFKVTHEGGYAFLIQIVAAAGPLEAMAVSDKSVGENSDYSKATSVEFVDNVSTTLTEPAVICWGGYVE